MTGVSQSFHNDNDAIGVDYEQTEQCDNNDSNAVLQTVHLYTNAPNTPSHYSTLQ